MPTSNSEDGSCPSRESSPDTAKTPLWMSLYVQSVTAPAVNGDTLTSVPSVNNPRPLRVMGDNAEYWVNDAGEPFTFKFPATLDLEGQFDRSGPYFNLPRTGLDAGAIKKMRAQFEVRPLEIQARDIYPEEAIKCSSSAIDMLNVLHGEAEEARNALLPSSASYPRDVPFWRRYPHGENERFSIVLTSDLLVRNVPDPSRSSVPRLRRCDIGKGDTMQSPSKAKAAAMAGGPPGGSASPGTNAEGPPRLSDLPDPLGRYAAVISQYSLWECTIAAPNIRDGRGALIGPQEYRTKLKTGDVVMVECYLKLWSIAPSRRENCPPEEKNGSRRYQVMLKSMKLLPDEGGRQTTFSSYFSDVKGKRKATDEPIDAQPSKRSAHYEDDEDDETQGGGSGSRLGDGHAMQVTYD
ncbi:hypothetical protein BD769DRAFT_1662256 [Suillus cothurnatus]|nr:hypothetical protein BD769DRAFT_1662256 [Suillus cothurnatus]